MNSEYITLSGLKERGWTGQVIQDLLGQPDRTKPNPHYRKAAPMRLYRLSRVEAAEASRTWMERQAWSATRRAGAAQATKTKRAKLLAEIAALTITVPVVPLEQLFRQARLSWSMGPHGGRDYQPPDEQLAVNYLRHECSSYEQNLTRIYGRVGTRDAYLVLNEKVYDAIAGAYPGLATECDRQMMKKEDAVEMACVCV